jgi:copper ion binding protein
MKKIYFIFLAALLMAACGTSTEKHTESEAASVTISPDAVQTIQISVSGMTCEGCVRSVKAAVAQLPGVQDVEVTLRDSSAIVSFDTTLVGFTQMQEAINDKGYKAIDYVVIEDNE